MMQTQIDRDGDHWVIRTVWVGDFSRTSYLPYQDGDTEWQALGRYFAQQEVRLT